MTQEKLIDAITDLDSDILNHYFDMKADLAAKKKPKKHTWLEWGSLAACLCFAIIVALIGGQSNKSSAAVINYGAFIFIPVLVVSSVPLCLFFVGKEKTLKSSLITSAIALAAVDMLNVLGVYLYSHFGGINILGNLPIILISSNVAAIISIVSITLLGRKIKTWWLKLLLWLTVSIIAIILACIVHNIVIGVVQGDMNSGKSAFSVVRILSVGKKSILDL